MGEVHLGHAERAAQGVARILATAEAEAERLIAAARERATALESEGARRLAELDRQADEMAQRRSRQLSRVTRLLAEQAHLLADQALLLGRQLEAIAALDQEAASGAAPVTAAGPDPAPQERENGDDGSRERAEAISTVSGHEPAVDDTAGSSGETRARSEDRSAALEGARLVALQMAVEGATRNEVDANLRRVFEVHDTGEVLDSVFGPGSAGARRL